MVFYFLVVLLPWGVFKRFIFTFSSIEGKKIIYLTPRLYATDIILLVLLLLSAVSLVTRLRPPATTWLKVLSKKYFAGLLFLGLLFLSSLFSLERQVSFYYLARFIFFYGFYLWLSQNINLTKEFSKIISLLLIAITFESLLAVGQFFKQSSVWGFWPLGEPPFSGSGIFSPRVSLAGDLKLRAFGTFSHPNVLGGFLAVSLIWVAHLIVARSAQMRGKVSFLIVFILGTLALFLSFSQAAWGAFLLGFCLYGFRALAQIKNRTGRWLGLILTSFTFTFLLLTIKNLPLERPTNHRAELAQIALQVFKTHPLWGVGLGNFIHFSPPDFTEPVHNIYFLILSEAGLPALIVFIYFLISHLNFAWRDASREKEVLAISLGQLLFLGVFDHYLLSAQQGSLLLWLVLGLIATQGK